jgi:hypothetical protein
MPEQYTILKDKSQAGMTVVGKDCNISASIIFSSKILTLFSAMLK